MPPALDTRGRRPVWPPLHATARRYSGAVTPFFVLSQMLLCPENFLLYLFLDIHIPSKKIFCTPNLKTWLRAWFTIWWFCKLARSWGSSHFVQTLESTEMHLDRLVAYLHKPHSTTLTGLGLSETVLNRLILAIFSSLFPACFKRHRFSQIVLKIQPIFQFFITFSNGFCFADQWVLVQVTCKVYIIGKWLLPHMQGSQPLLRHVTARLFCVEEPKGNLDGIPTALHDTGIFFISVKTATQNQPKSFRACLFLRVIL